MQTSNPFLTAEWRKLAMANYEVNPEILAPFVPAKTELDFYEGRCYVSLVGFMFVNTRVRGIAIPLHVNFEEVNLRFYVSFKDHGRIKRGVVFIKEIVPRRAITFVANTLYGEKYETMPMEHAWLQNQKRMDVTYRWKKDGQWNGFEINALNTPIDIAENSEEDFITNHFWGYTRIDANATSEYEVTHPVWSIYPVERYKINVDFGKVYGETFHFLTAAKPVSVYLAEGSEIAVMKEKAFELVRNLHNRFLPHQGVMSRFREARC
jgi:uncharacterized protein